MTGNTLIVGLGSSHGDDQFGWQVAAQLSRAPAQPSIAVRRARSPAELLDWLEGVERLIVCDACENQGAPGRLHRWQWPAAEVGRVRSSNSHDLGLAAVLTLAETLEHLPTEVLVVAAQGRQFEPAAPMSNEIEIAAAQAAEQLREELMRA